MKINKSIFNMFAQLKNSSQVYKQSCIVKRTKQNIKLLQFLYEQGYILGYSFENKDTDIRVILKYHYNKPLIRKITFISKTYKQVNCSLKLISKQKNENTLFIFYTTKGYMSILNAKLNNLGGQLICYIN